MAKKIKPIKCPSCGSSSITEIRPEYYKCNSCGTDFFLDNDDININHRYYNNTTENKLDSKTIKKIILIGLIILLGIISLNILFSPSKQTPNDFSTYSLPTETKKEEVKTISYKWESNSKKYAFLGNEKQPLVLVVGKIEESSYTNTKKDPNIYWACYDLKTSEKKFIRNLEEDKSNNSTLNLEIRQFEDNNIYIIVNSQNIYQIKPDLSIRKINEEYEKINPDLAIGIAQIKFGYKNNGSTFEIINNEGKQLVYLPLINKTYKKDKFYKAISKIPPNAETLTAYTFSHISDDFPDEKVQLVKYKYKHQNGYPKEVPRFEWIKDYHTYGIIYENSPYTKRFLRAYWKEVAKVTNYEILTSERNFFGAEVLAFNDLNILIKCYTTPNYSESNKLLQLLNTKNGEIEQSFNTNLSNIRENNYIINDGYIIETSVYNYLDRTGKIINVFDLNKVIIKTKN